MQSKEIDILMKDKTDFRKRLMLKAALKARKDGHSIEALEFLLKHDGVYKVRLTAWQALSEKGAQCAEPVAHPASGEEHQEAKTLWGLAGRYHRGGVR